MDSRDGKKRQSIYKDSSIITKQGNELIPLFMNTSEYLQ
jgi:hypothetical protein